MTGGPGEGPPPAILVVDDVPDNLKQLCELLEQSGYQAMPAQGGAWALKAAAMTPPDLVLLDIRMPGLDGFEVCRRLKEQPALRDIPVIFISALGDTADKVRAFEAGGVDYITKPFQHGEVLARVRTHLELRRLRLSLQHSLVLQISRRMESLQKLSNALAHQLRNPMTIISGFANLLLKKSALKHPRQEYLEGITCAAARIERIIQAVHAYNSLPPVRWSEIDLPAFIDSVRAAADRTAAAMSKTFDWMADVQARRFPADRELLFEALVAVITNALESFDQKRGLIRVSVKEKGESLFIEISDNGKGIPEADLPYVVDPFFTTKTVGVGMGLAKASRIAQEHYGGLEIHSRPGLGTSVAITIGRSPVR